MIALIKQPTSKRSRPAWHGSFEKMLPAIVRHAKFAFRYMPPDPREEAVAEVVANCRAAFARLVERDKQHVAAPSALARFAVAQYRDGRRATGRQSPKDAMSQIAQHRKGFGIGQLDHSDRDGGTWREVVVEDRRAGPAETAACRHVGWIFVSYQAVWCRVFRPHRDACSAYSHTSAARYNPGRLERRHRANIFSATQFERPRSKPRVQASQSGDGAPCL
jgi:hypothetical protein